MSEFDRGYTPEPKDLNLHEPKADMILSDVREGYGDDLKSDEVHPGTDDESELSDSEAEPNSPELKEWKNRQRDAFGAPIVPPGYLNITGLGSRKK